MSEEGKLRKTLGFWYALLGTIGVIFGTGIYVSIGLEAYYCGDDFWLAILIGFIPGLLEALIVSELATAFPKAGTLYWWMKYGLGKVGTPLAVFWQATTTLFLGAIYGVLVATACARYLVRAIYLTLGVMVPELYLIIAIIILNTIIALLKIEESVLLADIFTIIELSACFIAGALGFAFAKRTPEFFSFQFTLHDLALGVALAQVMLAGISGIAPMVEEMKEPAKDLPRVCVIGSVFVLLLHLWLGFGLIMREPGEVLYAGAPWLVALGPIIGTIGELILAWVIFTAVYNGGIWSILSTANRLYSMAEDGAVPSIFGKIWSKTGRPIFGAIYAAILSIITLLLSNAMSAYLGISLFEALSFIFAPQLALSWLFEALSCIGQRYTMPNIKRPYKVPLNIGRFPVLPLILIAVSLWAVSQVPLLSWIAIAGMMAFGAIYYYVYVRPRQQKVIEGGK